MASIHLTTFIAAPVERVFDLSRSVNLHKISTAHTHEKIVAGKMHGLISEGETVTWQAKHLYKERKFTSKITAMLRPGHFTDEMIQGDFKRFRHEHYFKQIDNGTIMIDVLEFESPYGIIGKLLNKFYLKKYLEQLLLKRNEVIKEYAESKKWVTIIPPLSIQ
jgi:ligand-binding SRPBCC domain-containing protein